MGDSSELINPSQVKSLAEAKQKFASSDYSLSYISENHWLEKSENTFEDFNHRLTITKNSVSTYRKWVEEWHKGRGNGCFASLPVLSVLDEWLEQGDGIPFIDTVLAKESTLYEPGDHTLASQRSELPEVLNQIRWLNLVVCRDDKISGWVIWDYNAIHAVLQETIIGCSSLPKTDHCFFLLHLLRNMNLCAQQFCPLTRDIAQIETDTRIGALNSMIAIVIDCLTNIHLEKDYSLSDATKEIIEIARFSDSEYILFDALQWFVT